MQFTSNYHSRVVIFEHKLLIRLATGGFDENWVYTVLWIEAFTNFNAILLIYLPFTGKFS